MEVAVIPRTHHREKLQINARMSSKVESMYSGGIQQRLASHVRQCTLPFVLYCMQTPFFSSIVWQYVHECGFRLAQRSYKGLPQHASSPGTFL